jgi:hypothetical protein
VPALVRRGCDRVALMRTVWALLMVVATVVAVVIVAWMTRGCDPGAYPCNRASDWSWVFPVPFAIAAVLLLFRSDRR